MDDKLEGRINYGSAAKHHERLITVSGPAFIRIPERSKLIMKFIGAMQFTKLGLLHRLHILCRPDVNPVPINFLKLA
ncbi:hypothetical protein [Roseobacter sp. GAI101]|uniref:hypothetical protein n=1 Tax=Roseobacter sp. (strain GAI101) TaxID=391589 RepID=UPI0012ED5C6B|nr:hypothetical protein [Roseobacter sp. GAI101]